jgi:hypothetical protein
VEDVRPAVIEGAEQSWIAFRTSLFDFGRYELVLVETTAHIAISLHALARLFERSPFQETDFLGLIDTATLWVVPLLYALGRSGLRAGAEIAIPYMSGLLLGTVEANPMTLEQGPTAATISKGKSRPEYLDPPFGSVGEGVMVLGINTYVGAQELFENQQDLYVAFEGFGNAFREPMRQLRSGMVKGLPDSRMLARFGPVLDPVSPEDLETLALTLEKFFATPEWQTHTEAHRRPKRFLH